MTARSMPHLPGILTTADLARTAGIAIIKWNDSLVSERSLRPMEPC
jgi:hypothetical protein